MQLTPTVCETSQETGIFLDLMPIGALVIDNNLQIVEWNRTLVDWASISKEQAVGSKLTDLFPNLAENRYLERLTQVFSSGFPATYSAALHKHFLPVPARHGLDCELMIQQTEVRPLAESCDLALITIQDVSFQYLQLDQLKKERADLVRTQDEIAHVNQQLVERNQELDDFTRSVSHDLQEPLRKITTFGQLFESNLEKELDEESQSYLFYMQDAARRMKAMIQDMLTLSRAGRAEILHEQLDLHEIVQSVLSLLEIAVTEHQATIHVDPLPTVSGDARLITQLYQNLIGNALKFSAHDSSRVSITAEQQGEQWILGVQDNGIGIEEKNCNRIFDPFVKLHARNEYEGTGFGLSICKKAVQRHGGKIWVESQPGEGAHFKFTLPSPEKPESTVEQLDD